jgi:hypothetical protein
MVLLCTELDDERVMRLCLERLLCWRETPERWSTYQHMLPILILATSLRQHEHWQNAVETSPSNCALIPRKVRWPIFLCRKVRMRTRGGSPGTPSPLTIRVTCVIY